VTNNIKYLLPAVLSLVIFGKAGSAHSAPYQFQIVGGYSQTESEFKSSFGPSFDSDSDSKSIRLTYFLRPVDATSGPLRERAFLSKSAWLSGSYRIAESRQNNALEVKSTTVNTRFVTQADFIVELDYEISKFDNFDDNDPTYSFGAGLYLDRNTTALLKLRHADNDINTLTLNYKKVLEGAAPGPHIGFSGGLSYIDTDFDSGYRINLNGRYYFSDAFSVGAGLSLRSVGESDSDTWRVSSEYFLTDSIFGGATYSVASADELFEDSTLALNVGARF